MSRVDLTFALEIQIIVYWNVSIEGKQVEVDLCRDPS